jgi:hypothetical protein
MAIVDDADSDIRRTGEVYHVDSLGRVKRVM